MTDGSLSLVKVLNDCQKEVKQSLRASQNNFNFNGRKFQTKYRQHLNSQAPEQLRGPRARLARSGENGEVEVR